MELTYCAAVDVSGCGLAVRHCTLHDGPHVAIWLRNPSRECEVSWNEIHSVCLESGEMGAIYAGRDWTTCGNRIEANWLHDIYSIRPQPVRAVMLDDGGAGFTIASNWFMRVTEGVSLSGVGNAVEHNVFIDCGRPITAWLVDGNAEAGRIEPSGIAGMPPLCMIGVRNAPDRATWPVLHSVTANGGTLDFAYYWESRR